MKPVLTGLSESAALAAGLVIETGKAVQEIGWKELEQQLRSNGPKL